MEGQLFPGWATLRCDNSNSNIGQFHHITQIRHYLAIGEPAAHASINIGTTSIKYPNPTAILARAPFRVMASDSLADDSAKLAILKDALYEEIRQHGSETRLFTQKDLLDLNIIPNNNVLLLVRVVQGLTDDKLLVGTTNHHAGLAWRWRSREEAKK